MLIVVTQFSRPSVSREGACGAGRTATAGACGAGPGRAAAWPSRAPVLFLFRPPRRTVRP